MKTTRWPKIINTKVQRVIDAIAHIIEEDEDVQEKHMREELARLLFSKYVQDADINLTSSEFENIYCRAVVKTELEVLMRRGILGCVEDDKGEEVVYFTELGKKAQY